MSIFVVANWPGGSIGTIGGYRIGTDYPENGRMAINGNVFENSDAIYHLQNFVFNTLKIEKIFGFMHANGQLSRAEAGLKEQNMLDVLVMKCYN